MKKKTIIVMVIVLLVVVVIGLYGTYATSLVASNTNDTYNVTLNNSLQEITIPSGSSKSIIYHITNTNNGIVQYGVVYSGSNINVKIYDDSENSVTGTFNYGENKYIKLYITNSGTSDSTATIKTVLGYENGGDLIIPSGYTLVTKMYTKPKNLTTFITNLYTNASKTTVTNNSITYNYDTTNYLMKDIGGNIRYYGASPNNYIYFNCSDYSNQSSSTCETWRIIGVFDGKVKLIRNESIGAYSWDNKDIDSTWETASLMKLLNPGYESETVGGSLYYNSGSGNCYSGQRKATTACNFTSSGLKNDITKNVIAKQDWNIGPTYQKYVNVEYENEVKNTFKAYIGLPNVSDYGYATNLNLCSAELVNYSNSECKNNNWMFYMATGSKKLAYFINYASNSGLGGLAINALTEGGNVEIFDNDINDTIPTTSSDIFPTVYLSNLVSITDGTGTSSNPYQLQVN